MDDRKKYLITFIVLLILTIIDYIIPDPIPVLDEVILTLGTALFGGKMIASKNNGK